MYEYKIPAKIANYVRHILVRGYHEFQETIDEADGSHIFTAPEKPELFGRIYDRAWCEKESQKDGGFYITQAEAQDEPFKLFLRDITGRHGFEILKESPERDMSWQEVSETH